MGKRLEKILQSVYKHLQQCELKNKDLSRPKDNLITFPRSHKWPGEEANLHCITKFLTQSNITHLKAH